MSAGSSTSSGTAHHTRRLHTHLDATTASAFGGTSSRPMLVLPVPPATGQPRSSVHLRAAGVLPSRTAGGSVATGGMPVVREGAAAGLMTDEETDRAVQRLLDHHNFRNLTSAQRARRRPGPGSGAGPGAGAGAGAAPLGSSFSDSMSAFADAFASPAPTTSGAARRASALQRSPMGPTPVPRAPSSVRTSSGRLGGSGPGSVARSAMARARRSSGARSELTPGGGGLLDDTIGTVAHGSVGMSGAVPRGARSTHRLTRQGGAAYTSAAKAGAQAMSRPAAMVAAGIIAGSHRRRRRVERNEHRQRTRKVGQRILRLNHPPYKVLC